MHESNQLMKARFSTIRAVMAFDHVAQEALQACCITHHFEFILRHQQLLPEETDLRGRSQRYTKQAWAIQNQATKSRPGLPAGSEHIDGFQDIKLWQPNFHHPFHWTPVSRQGLQVHDPYQFWGFPIQHSATLQHVGTNG